MLFSGNQHKPHQPTEEEKRLANQKRLLEQELKKIGEELKKTGQDTFNRQNSR